MLTESPGAAIVKAPEGDAFDDVLVFLEDREQLRIIVRLTIQILGGGRRRVTLASAAEASTKLATGCSANGDIQFCNADLQTQRRIV